MAGCIAARVDLTTDQHQELTALSRAHSTPQKLAERARIIFLAADGVSVTETARQLGIWRKTALIVVTIIWGGIFIVVQNALSATGPFLFVGLRF